MKYDFSGYATKNDLRCADGRVIRKDAFKDNDGQTVPLVWQHNHGDLNNVLGHVELENRPDGVYAYGFFNEDTPQGKNAKMLVEHGDINAMSIYANRLKQSGENVVHGLIREVSLVLAGANPGAFIDNISFAHSDGTYTESEEEAVIYTGLPLSMPEPEILHEASGQASTESTAGRTVRDVWNGMSEKKKNVVYFLIAKAIEGDDDDDIIQNGVASHADDDGETIRDIFNTMTEEEKNVTYAMIGQAVEDAENGKFDDDDDEVEHFDYEGETFMKHNIFDATADESNVLSHDELVSIFDDAKRLGTLKDAVIAHGITDIDLLFPEAKAVTTTPEFIARKQEWVSKVWNATRKSPFARVKTMAADITADEARARGYVKGNKKVEEVFSLLKRVTTPQTVYKLQKLDRDDVIDITDFDVVAWMKAEMRMMLDEELSRAILIGDGRSASSNDKIKEDNIRPVYTDDDLYTIKYLVTLPTSGDDTDRSNALVDAALRSRKDYKGSGMPTFYASVDVINDMLLAKDKMGRRLYATLTELADALRVKEIVEVPVLEGANRTVEGKIYDLLGLIVNLQDYTIGADKGGAVTLFDDFNLDYNKYEYLIETRCSGALTKAHSAIALELERAQG